MTPEQENDPRVTVAISEKVHSKLKVACAIRGKAIREGTEDAITEWVGKPAQLGTEAAEAVSR